MLETGSISDIMQTIIANALRPISRADAAAFEDRNRYNESFYQEGRRKVKFVVDSLAELSQRKSSLFDPEKAVVLSIGGSDGSDAVALMTGTAVRHGVLLEYDNAAGQAAAQMAGHATDYLLKVVIGDASQKLAEALDTAREIAPHATTLIVLCFGVLHELPTRSPNFLHDRMLDQLFSAFPNVLIYITEPCSQPEFPIGWPEIVEIGFLNADVALLPGVARHVRDRLFQGKVPEPELRGKWVRMHRDLAVEILHKTLRFNSVARFHHEMQERLTSYQADALMRLAAQRWPGVQRNLSYFTTPGFLDAYDHHQVQARDESGHPLASPLTHCRLMLHLFAAKQNEDTATPTAPEGIRPPVSASAAGAQVVTNSAGRDVMNISASTSNGGDLSIRIVK